MFSKKKINTPLLVVIFFVLVTLNLPLTLYAGPSNRVGCPCFSIQDALRYAHPPFVSCQDETDNNWYWISRSTDNYERQKIYATFSAAVDSSTSGPNDNTWCEALVVDLNTQERIIDVNLDNIDPFEAYQCTGILQRVCKERQFE